MDSPNTLAEANPTCGLAVDAGQMKWPVIQSRSPADADLPPFGPYTQTLMDRRGRENATTSHTPKMAAILITMPHTNNAASHIRAASGVQPKRPEATNSQRQLECPMTCGGEKPHSLSQMPSAGTQKGAAAVRH
ncbi:Hypothetical predicted protein [Pelobates cultripes]|uniref:Uncharacterized protein n=1 Tax=Pelobates cultripes TaxID=61616 RepID=A0AAD1VW33_PELCU|nr:Hypothetical predicted protein [Pelobates cultripes]